MTTAQQVYELALSRYGVVRAPQLAAVYATLPDADPEVSRRVAAKPAIVAVNAARRMLGEAEALTGTTPDDLLRMNVYDPRCGVGTFLVAAAARLAYGYARRLKNRSEPPRRLAQRLLPDIILACVYGMDTDPLAVELARLALSLETEGRLPPKALERHIICGDYRAGDVPPAKRARMAYLGMPARYIQ